MSADLPPVDDVSRPWWEATRERRLLLQRCSGCQVVQHHPRLLCTSCGATDTLEWITASGTGRLDCYTVVHRAPAPGIEVPYVVARVRLAEGPMMLTSVVGTRPEDTFGIDLELDWRPLEDGRHLPVFKVPTVPNTEQGT